MSAFSLLGGVSLRIDFFATSFAGSASPAVARTVANVRAIAVTAVTRVFVLVIADQEIRGRMLRTPPENREVEGHLRNGVGFKLISGCSVPYLITVHEPRRAAASQQADRGPDVYHRIGSHGKPEDEARRKGERTQRIRNSVGRTSNFSLLFDSWPEGLVPTRQRLSFPKIW